MAGISSSCFLLSYLLVVVYADPFHKTETLLRNTLLGNYDKRVPPRVNSDDNVTVTIGIAIISIDELDIARQTLYTHIWERLFWTDSRLAWSPADYNGLDVLSVTSTLLWKPDIVPYNLAASEYGPSTEYNMVVHSGGSVAYIPHIRLATTCATSLKAFPFDTQTCKIKLGSWTYPGNVVTLTNQDADGASYQDNTVWELVETTSVVNTQHYACCIEPYMDYNVNITLKRRSDGMTKMFVAPAVCIALLIPSLFLLPAGSSYKLVLGACLLISQVLMLDMLAEVIPINDFTPPILVLYYLANIVLICVSMALSTVIINLWERAKRGGTGVPPVVDQVFLGVFGRLLCVRREDYFLDSEGDAAPKSDQNSDDHGAMVKEYTHLVAPAEWRQLSVILDRLLFMIFLVVAIAMTIAMMTYHSKA